MKIDHLVVNVDKEIQADKNTIEAIQLMGLPYKPTWGKGTKGFKVSNIWIGKEYFELVRIKREDGGGWIRDWTTKYLNGHRGLIGFAIEVEDIEATYKKLIHHHVEASPPEPLQFRWFFNLLTKTMPWRNCYLPEFEGVPFQFFLQQLDNEKAKQYMEQYMVPNSKENGINGISEVIIYGQLTEGDKKIIYALFETYEEKEEALIIHVGQQTIRFFESDTFRVEVILQCDNDTYGNKEISFHNLRIRNA